MTRILIKAGADVNARDEDGRTALISAAGRIDTPEVLAVLLNAGATGYQEAWEEIQYNEVLNDTDVYWRLNDLRFE